MDYTAGQKPGRVLAAVVAFLLGFRILLSTVEYRWLLMLQLQKLSENQRVESEAKSTLSQAPKLPLMSHLQEIMRGLKYELEVFKL